MGGDIVIDLTKNQRGVAGTHAGAIKVDGSLLCPGSPEGLLALPDAFWKIRKEMAEQPRSRSGVSGTRSCPTPRCSRCSAGLWVAATNLQLRLRFEQRQEREAALTADPAELPSGRTRRGGRARSPSTPTGRCTSAARSPTSGRGLLVPPTGFEPASPP
jgi:hypothetical protein